MGARLLPGWGRVDPVQAAHAHPRNPAPGAVAWVGQGDQGRRRGRPVLEAFMLSRNRGAVSACGHDFKTLPGNTRQLSMGNWASHVRRSSVQIGFSPAEDPKYWCTAPIPRRKRRLFMASLADVLVRQLLDGRHIASLATENPACSSSHGCGVVLVRRYTCLCGHVLA